MYTRLRSRFSTALLCQLALLAVFLALPVALWALQGDSTTAPPRDIFGVFGPVLDHFWSVIATLLVSATTWVAAKANAGFRKAGDGVKWVFMYFFALLYNYIGAKIGWAPLDPLAPALTLGLVQTGAAATIYYFGKHRVPDVTETARSASVR